MEGFGGDDDVRHGTDERADSDDPFLLLCFLLLCYRNRDTS